MRDGAIVQIATPERLWAAPADAWVARFIGLANVEEHGDNASSRVPKASASGPTRPATRSSVEPSRRPGGDAARSVRRRPEIVSAHDGLDPPSRHRVSEIDRAWSRSDRRACQPGSTVSPATGQPSAGYVVVDALVAEPRRRDRRPRIVSCRRPRSTRARRRPTLAHGQLPSRRRGAGLTERYRGTGVGERQPAALGRNPVAGPRSGRRAR